MWNSQKSSKYPAEAASGLFGRETLGEENDSI